VTDTLAAWAEYEAHLDAKDLDPEQLGWLAEALDMMRSRALHTAERRALTQSPRHLTLTYRPDQVDGDPVCHVLVIRRWHDDDMPHAHTGDLDVMDETTGDAWTVCAAEIERGDVTIEARADG
jgi:hypothetical protein